MSKVKRVFKWVVIGAAFLFVVIQFFGPARTNPVTNQAMAMESHMQVPANVKPILDRSCADCHSNNTRWPWYSKVAPVSWFVIDHVDVGRSELNFSHWGLYETRRQLNLLDEMCELSGNGEMPLSSYTPLHPGSKLTTEEVKALCDWTMAESKRLESR